MQIKSNILKLVRIFRRDDMQAKLARDYKDVRPTQNEIAAYLTQFEKMKTLWNIKLQTSMEENNRMMEAVETSSKYVKDLADQLKQKKENLDKYVKNSREAKEQARLEIESLRKAKTDLTAEKYQLET